MVDLESWGQHTPTLDPELTPKYDVNKTEGFNAPSIKLARLLHLKGYPYERIFLLTHLPAQKYAKFQPAWDKLRDRVDEAIIEGIRKEAIAKKAEDFVHKGMAIANKFLDNLIKRQDELSPKDFKLISDSIANIHRVGQLEKGAPTDISMYNNMDSRQLTDYLMATARTLKSKYGDYIEVPVDLDIPREEQALAILAQESSEAD